MNFSFQKDNMINVLGKNMNQLEIPRYQRDYEWNERNTINYFEDLIDNIKFNQDSNKLDNTEYFFGTFLLKGEEQQKRQTLEVIDGQQRLTTTIVFLSSLYHTIINLPDVQNKLNGIENEERAFNDAEVGILIKLADGIYKKSLMTDEVDESLTRKTLVIESNDNFYEKLIYENSPSVTPTNGSEDKLLQAHKYFKKVLSPKELSQIFNQRVTQENISYTKMLMSVYEQLGFFIVVLLITESDKEATSMFESLNSKGAPLTQVDLIKNKIFSKMTQVEPLDNAKETWKNIKNELSVDGFWHNFDDFFETYWNSNIKTISKRNLYQSFLDEYEEADEARLLDLLNSLYDYSKSYTKIFGKDSFNFVAIECRSDIKESIKVLTNSLGIKQVNGLLLQLVYCYELGLIAPATLKNYLKFMADFHIIYNGLFKRATNSLRQPYFNASQKIGTISKNNKNKKMKKEDIGQVLNELKGKLLSNLPSQSNLDTMLKEIDWDLYTYTNKIETKTQLNKNNLTKYIVYSVTRNKNSETLDHMNIEHMINDNVEHPYSLQLGNLVMLERPLNRRCGNKPLDQKILIYNETHNQVLKELLALKTLDSGLNEEKIIERNIEVINSLYKSIR